LADLVCVDPALVARAWPLAKELIKSAIDRTGLSDFGELETQVLKGDQLLCHDLPTGKVDRWRHQVKSLVRHIRSSLS